MPFFKHFFINHYYKKTKYIFRQILLDLILMSCIQKPEPVGRGEFNLDIYKHPLHRRCIYINVVSTGKKIKNNLFCILTSYYTLKTLTMSPSASCIKYSPGLWTGIAALTHFIFKIHIEYYN